VLTPSVYDTLLLGQVNLLVAACVLGALVCTRGERGRWRDPLAGALIALATLIKVYPAAYALAFVFRRRIRALTGFGLVLAAGIWFGAGLSGGPQPTRDYLARVLPRLALQPAARVENQSLLAAVSRMTSRTELEFRVSLAERTARLALAPALDAPRAGRALALLARVAVVLILLSLLARRAASQVEPWGSDAAFALITVSVLLANSISWTYYFVLLVMPAAYLIRSGAGRRTGVRVPLLAAAFLLLINRYWVPLLYWTWSPWVTIEGCAAVVILWVLVVREVARTRRSLSPP